MAVESFLVMVVVGKIFKCWLLEGASESRKDATGLETMTSTAGKNVATNDQASLLEMEDEFEEFELEDWDPSSEDVSNEQLWERDWDDDMPAEDFAKQLHEELARGAK